MPEYGPGEGDRRPSYAPFEHVTRVQAIRDFVDWLYDTDADIRMPREDLVQAYWSRVSEEAIQSAATSVRAVRGHEPHPLHGPDDGNTILPFPVQRPDQT